MHRVQHLIIDMDAPVVVFHAGCDEIQSSAGARRESVQYVLRQVEYSQMLRPLISDLHAWIAVTRCPRSLQYSTVPYLLFNVTTAQGTGLGGSAGKEDPAELDSSPIL